MIDRATKPAKKGLRRMVVAIELARLRRLLTRLLTKLRLVERQGPLKGAVEMIDVTDAVKGLQQQIAQVTQPIVQRTLGEILEVLQGEIEQAMEPVRKAMEQQVETMMKPLRDQLQQQVEQALKPVKEQLQKQMEQVLQPFKQQLQEQMQKAVGASLH